MKIMIQIEKFVSNCNKNSLQSENKSLQIADFVSNRVKNLLHITINISFKSEISFRWRGSLQIVRNIDSYSSLNSLDIAV